MELQELAAQLREPKGQNGIETAKNMNVTNVNMIAKTINELDLGQNAKVLEIGPGNALHLKEIFKKNLDITYHGIDISQTMIDEATQTNGDFVAQNKAIFSLVDGKKIPFPDQSFDVIFTVNTIYFWESPELFLREIKRVLSQNGQLVIAYIPERVMRKIPFAQFNFNWFCEEKIEALLQKNNFESTLLISEKEDIISNSGEKIERIFNIVVAKNI